MKKLWAFRIDLRAWHLLDPFQPIWPTKRWIKTAYGLVSTSVADSTWPNIQEGSRAFLSHVLRARALHSLLENSKSDNFHQLEQQFSSKKVSGRLQGNLLPIRLRNFSCEIPWLLGTVLFGCKNFRINRFQWAPIRILVQLRQKAKCPPKDGGFWFSFASGLFHGDGVRLVVSLRNGLEACSSARFLSIHRFKAQFLDEFCSCAVRGSLSHQPNKRIPSSPVWSEPLIAIFLRESFLFRALLIVNDPFAAIRFRHLLQISSTGNIKTRHFDKIWD